MSTRNELKRIRALHQKKYRQQEGLFLVQGPKLVRELIHSGWHTEVIYATDQAAAQLGDHPLLEVLPAHELDRLGTLEHGNELVAVVRMRDLQIPERPGHEELLFALDGVTDPGNMGTILRIADWFGVDNVFCTPGSVEVYNPKCVQASMGAIFRVKVHQVPLVPELQRMAAQGASIYQASMEGSPVFDLPLKRPAILVLGSESHGISAEVRQVDGQLVSIPGSGRSESLNVATAAAALCMEFSRQLRTP